MSTETAQITVTNWFEVYSPTVDSAVHFYETVFGWTKESMPMGPGETYWMLKNGETVFTGVMDLNHPNLEGVPPHWGLYLHTDDCAGTIEKVKALGGEVVYGPMAIPDIGTVAGFKDNSGAHFNVHQPLGERNDMSGAPVTWIEHMSADREKAVAFYKDLFGWGSMDMEMGEGVGTYSMFTVGESPVAGCMQVPGGEMPANWTMYLYSQNLEQTLEKVSAAGGKVMQPPMDIGQFGRIAIAADCCGAVFGIHEPPTGM